MRNESAQRTPVTRLSAVSSLRVVDLGRGLPAGIMAKFFAEAGAAVMRIEPPEGDPFRTVYPAYEAWYERVNYCPLDNMQEELSAADVCLIGGEDHPDLNWSFSAEDLSKQYPRLIVVEV